MFQSIEGKWSKLSSAIQKHLVSELLKLPSLSKNRHIAWAVIERRAKLVGGLKSLASDDEAWVTYRWDLDLIRNEHPVMRWWLRLSFCFFHIFLLLLIFSSISVLQNYEDFYLYYYKYENVCLFVHNRFGYLLVQSCFLLLGRF